MRYTITALATDHDTIAVMRKNLLAVGAEREAIITRSGRPGVSQSQISIRTSDLEASESYRDVLELAGASVVTSSEESSVLKAIG